MNKHFSDDMREVLGFSEGQIHDIHESAWKNLDKSKSMDSIELVKIIAALDTDILAKVYLTYIYGRQSGIAFSNEKDPASCFTAEQLRIAVVLKESVLKHSISLEYFSKLDISTEEKCQIAYAYGTLCSDNMMARLAAVSLPPVTEEEWSSIYLKLAAMGFPEELISESEVSFKNKRKAEDIRRGKLEVTEK